jgi:multicomponent Na+:H+ antiporter subunit G
MSRVSVSELVGVALLAGGAFFFLAGTVGLLRFPDVYCRLHALTKADNLGLGLTLLGLMLQAGSWFTVAKLAIIWLLVLLASTTACHAIARAALQHGVEPWRRP